MVTAKNMAKIIKNPNSFTPSFTVVIVTQIPSESAYPVVPSPERIKAKKATTAAIAPVARVLTSLFILFTKKSKQSSNYIRFFQRFYRGFISAMQKHFCESAHSLFGLHGKI